MREHEGMTELSELVESPWLRSVMYPAAFLGMPPHGLTLHLSPSDEVDALLHQHFPSLAELYKDTSDFWKGDAGNKSWGAPFGPYFSMAVNVDIGAKVSSIPHRDVKNLSVGLCCIFVFGACRTGGGQVPFTDKSLIQGCLTKTRKCGYTAQKPGS